MPEQFDSLKHKTVPGGFVEKTAIENPEKAQEEASKMQDKIKSGEVKNYNEAEKLVDGIKAPKKKEVENNKEIILTKEQQDGYNNLLKTLEQALSPNWSTDLKDLVFVANSYSQLTLPKEIFGSPEIQSKIKAVIKNKIKDIFQWDSSQEEKLDLLNYIGTFEENLYIPKSLSQESARQAILDIINEFKYESNIKSVMELFIGDDQGITSDKISEWQNDSDVQELNRKIENQNGRNEAIFMDRVCDIYNKNFATHSTRRKSLAAVLQDGIFSKKRALQYNSDKEGGFFESFHEKNMEQQGPDRVSVISVTQVINAIDNIENNYFKTNIIADNIKIKKPEGLSISDVYSNGVRKKIIEMNGVELSNEEKNNLKNSIIKQAIADFQLEINKIMPEANILDYVIFASGNSTTSIEDLLSSDYYDSFDLRIKLDQEIEIGKDEYLKAFFYLLAHLFKAYRTPNRPYIEKIKKELEGVGIEQKPQPNINIQKLYNLFEDINMDELRMVLIENMYGNRWDGDVSIIIDTDLIDELSMDKTIEVDSRGIFFDPFIKDKLTVSGETPILNQVKKESFYGIICSDTLNNRDPDIVATRIKSTINSINFDFIKEDISDDNLKLIQSIKDGKQVNPKDLLMFASSFFEYSFFKTNLSEKDWDLAIANYYRMPVYSVDGGLEWPRKMHYKEVKDFVKKRNKEKEQIEL